MCSLNFNIHNRKSLGIKRKLILDPQVFQPYLGTFMTVDFLKTLKFFQIKVWAGIVKGSFKNL